MTYVKKSFFFLAPMSAFLIGLIPQDASNPWMMMPFVILAVYLILSGRLIQVNLQDPILLMLLLLWFGWIWGSIFSSVTFASEVTLLVLGVLPMSYLCAVGRDVKSLLYFFCLVMTSMAAWAFAQIYILPDPPWRAQLFFEDANIPGALFACGIILTLIFYFSTDDKRIKFVIYIALATLLAGLICTQSRSALFSGIAATAIVIFKNKNYFSRRTLKMFIPLAVVFVTGLFFTTFFNRLAAIMQGDKDVLARLSLWRSAMHMAFINPVHGIGLGTFHIYYPLYRMVNDDSGGFWVHMDPLQWAVETGWGTAIVFYALAAYIFYRMLQKSVTKIQIGAGATLLIIFLADHVGYILHVIPMLILSGVMLAQFASPVTEISPRRYTVAISIMIVILCGLWSVMRTGPTLYFWTKAMEAFDARDADSYTANITKCISDGDRRFPACRIQSAQLLINTAAEPNPEVMLWLRQADAQNPMSPDIPLLRAKYHMKVDPDNIKLQEDELHQALSRDPGYWPARRMLVNLLIQHNDFKEAYETLQIQKNRWMEGTTYLEYHELENRILENLIE